MRLRKQGLTVALRLGGMRQCFVVVMVEGVVAELAELRGVGANSTQTTTTIKYERAIVRYTQKSANNTIKLSVLTRVLFCYISPFSTVFCRV
jgi:hypothetical protein